MKWMRERDLLIAQTMAFVQSVTGRKPDAEKPAYLAPPPERPAGRLPDIEAMLAETIATTEPPKLTQPPKLIQPGRPAGRSEYQNEIQARVANFRAHQQRFLREREAYCTATMAKVQASLRKDARPPRLGK